MEQTVTCTRAALAVPAVVVLVHGPPPRQTGLLCPRCKFLPPTGGGVGGEEREGAKEEPEEDGRGRRKRRLEEQPRQFSYA